MVSPCSHADSNEYGGPNHIQTHLMNIISLQVILPTSSLPAAQQPSVPSIAGECLALMLIQTSTEAKVILKLI